MNPWAQFGAWLNGIVQDFAGRYDSVSQLYPPFEESINALLLVAKANGLDVGIHQGFRSWEEQDRLYAKGRTTKGPRVTNAKGGESRHQFGIAADIVFRENGKWSWAEKHNWKRLGELGEGLGLEWGGSWDKLKDRPHMQWKTEMTLSQARSLYKKGGLQEVWNNL